MTRYIELCNSVMDRGNIVALDEYRPQICEHAVYTSLFTYHDDLLEHVEKQKKAYEHELKYSEDTAKFRPMENFNGKVSARVLWFDIDNADIEEARHDALRLLFTLNDRFGMHPDDALIFFSGGKGFHVGIYAGAIGIQDMAYPELPDHMKAFVWNITRATANIESVDQVIYNRTRIFRSPMSRHEKSGLYKIYIPYSILSSGTVAQIKDYAKSPNPFKTNITPRAMVLNPRFSELFDLCRKGEVAVTERKSLSPTGKPVEKQKSIFTVPAQNRNHTLYAMAYRLFSIPDVTVYEATDIMEIIFNAMNASGHGKDFSQREFDKLMLSAKDRSRRHSSVEIEISDKPMGWLDNAMKGISTMQVIPMGYERFDDDLDGGLALGNLYGIVGPEGSKKTILMHDVMAHTAKQGDLVIDVQLEMSEMQVLDRWGMRYCGFSIKKMKQSGTLTDDHLLQIKMAIRENMGENYMPLFLKNVGPYDVAAAVKKIEERTGKKAKLVGIDSIGAMKQTKGEEILSIIENSKQLKDVAKETNTAVIFINHTASGITKHHRNQDERVRGGMKIRANADAMISVSLVLDAEESNLNLRNPDYKYINDLVWIRLYNKRESGNILDIVAKLESNFTLSDTGLDPKEFEMSPGRVSHR